MSDDFDTVRRLQPDRVRPSHPGDPAVFARQKEQLMSTIESTGETSDIFVSPGIYPRLAYRDVGAALDYLIQVFGLTEIREARMETETGMLAWLRLGKGMVMIGHANHDVHHIYSPDEVGGQTTVMVNVAVSDVDGHYARAVDEGADITMPLDDAFYGERRYEATDLEGHRWHFSESFTSIRARGGRLPDDT